MVAKVSEAAAWCKLNRNPPKARSPACIGRPCSASVRPTWRTLRRAWTSAAPTFSNARQICTTVDHAFLPEAKVGAFVDLAPGIVTRRYGTLDSPDCTSIISRGASDRLVSMLDKDRARGALVTPLLHGAAFDEARHRIAPHVVVGALDDTELMGGEVFGPILPLVNRCHPKNPAGVRLFAGSSRRGLPARGTHRRNRPLLWNTINRQGERWMWP